MSIKSHINNHRTIDDQFKKSDTEFKEDEKTFKRMIKKGVVGGLIGGIAGGVVGYFIGDSIVDYINSIQQAPDVIKYTIEVASTIIGAGAGSSIGGLIANIKDGYKLRKQAYKKFKNFDDKFN